MPEVPSRKAAAARVAVTLKVALRGCKPPIWRRIVVPGTMTLGALHVAIQVAMGWTDSHLHAFKIGGRRFGDPRQLEDASDEDRMTVDRVIASGVERFGYTYDFGDDWDHVVTVEKAVPQPDGLVLPTCVAGRRRCPPEDCGGAWGYAELDEALADPEHPDHAERSDWLDGELDAEAFSLEEVNAALGAAFAPVKGRRGVWSKA